MDEDILMHALSLPESEREKYLRDACADEAQRKSILALVSESTEADLFFGMTPEVAGGRGLFECEWENRAGAAIGAYLLRERLGEGGVWHRVEGRADPADPANGGGEVDQARHGHP